MTGQDIKNCPFCGGEPIKNEGKADNGAERYWISCRSCAAHGGWGKTETLAIGWWNMRDEA